MNQKYFGLNHFGWFTHVYDKITGEDYLPLIKKTTLEKGFLPADAEQRDQSWLDTYGMVETMVRDFPDYLQILICNTICIQTIKLQNWIQIILEQTK